MADKPNTHGFAENHGGAEAKLFRGKLGVGRVQGFLPMVFGQHHVTSVLS